MNKKILVSSLVIGVVILAAIGGTIAYFVDKETSVGNILVAGDINLKVDHTKQTYNGVDCKTCNLTLISDNTNNLVTETGVNAVYVGSNPPYFIHSAWTAQNDPALLAAGAKWIWATDPTREEDTYGKTYTFVNKFDWYGPIEETDLWMAVGSDNNVVVYLNNEEIGRNDGEFGYKQGSMLHILASAITANILQGQNTLKFEVTNWDQLHDPMQNPGGLIYKFSIDGRCGDDYFRNNCTLFGEKDITTEKFWMFNDVKPGDWGSNVISLHVYTNDAWMCMAIKNATDTENTWTQPEKDDEDTTEIGGELSSIISLKAWIDTNANGVRDCEEAIIYDGPFANASIAIADATHGTQLTGNTTYFIGLEWCAGSYIGGVCNGYVIDNKAQTDSLTADLEFEAIQARNNASYACANAVAWPQVQEQCAD